MTPIVLLRGTLRYAAALGAILLAVPYLASQDKNWGMPPLANARLEQRMLEGSLAAEITKLDEQNAQAQWIGYAVPQMANDRQICCQNYGGSWGNGDCRICRLENGEHGTNITSPGSETVKLEGPRNVVVLLRTESHRVVKIRVASEECTLDAGGLPFIWLTGVKPAESVALLAGYVPGNDFDEHDGRSVGQGALTAIALHADESADRAMDSFVRPEQREQLRKQAAFWLGEARGKTGLLALQRMAKNDPSSDVRAHVTFALSVSREPAALDEMIRMAKDDESTHVRSQALFWLAQKAGKKAVGTITGAIENDPDTEVKKKAVFALSQLPKDEGVPKLIEVAETNRNPAVRKQAMFWLGQSNDPRALAFFEKILSQ
jgi:HEAT repeat protein